MAKIITDKNKIEEVLTRGVVEFIDPKGEFRKKLEISPEKIIIKYGVDPTRPDIHLGHAVCFRKLRQFQNLGCKIIFIVGDFTAQIGDPSGKNKTRPEILYSEISKNMETYLKQADKIIKTEKRFFDWERNCDWYESIHDFTKINDQSMDNIGYDKKFEEFIKTRKKRERGISVTFTLINLFFVLRKITYGKLIIRDMFKERIKEGDYLYMHEMLYPVLQGIDSAIIKKIYSSCDLEIGGTDQTFNMLMGRDVMEIEKQEPQAVMTIKLLEGTDGKEKMSKSLNNYIGITEEPNQIFGKTMSIPDSSIINYFELCTDVPMDEVEEIKLKFKSDSVNPRDLKMKLAYEIVKIYHGEEKAKEAEKYFVKTVQKKEVPEEVKSVKLKIKSINIVDLLVEIKLAVSKGEARRLTEQGGIKINNKVVKDIKKEIVIGDEELLVQRGKRQFVKVKKM